jgi:putative flippase GtrA
MPERSFIFFRVGMILVQFRYLIVGLWNTIFGIAIFYLLLKFLIGTDYRLILFVSFVLANLQSHLTQRVLVWRSQERYFAELIRFFAGAVGVFVINLFLLTFLVDYLGYATFKSQVFLTLLLTILNYFFQKHAIFKVRQS